MRKIVNIFILLLMVLFMFTGCSKGADNVGPMAFMIDGELYYCYDEVIEISNVEILGYIASTLDDMTRVPSEDEQSNFALCLNQPYGELDGRILLYYSDNWHKCYLASEIMEGNALPREIYSIKIESIEADRISRREIGISWSGAYDDVADVYVVKRRAAEKGQGVGDWNIIATIESDKIIDESGWQYIDELEGEEPQQYEYCIDMEINDTEHFIPVEGKKVLGSNIKICIDPGHYNIAREVADADEYRYVEGNFVLELALELRDVLKEKYGIDSCLTREKDTITLGGYTDDELDSAHISLRGEFAAEEDCDLFVSLHTNSNAEEANGYETFFQPITINKPIIIINTVALESDIAMKTANTIGVKLASVNFELGLSDKDAFREVTAATIGEWTQDYNDGLSEVGTVVVRTGKKNPDYYGVLRGATNVGVPGMIIEHGYHSVAEVRKVAVTGDLKEVWANADAVGIAYGFGFTE